MDLKKYLTVKQISELVNKSVITIKRHIKQNNYPHIRKKIKNRDTIHVLQSDIESYYLNPTSNDSITDGINDSISDTVLDVLKHQLETKDKQIEEKDNQIKELIERTREGNLLQEGLRKQLENLSSQLVLTSKKKNSFSLFRIFTKN